MAASPPDVAADATLPLWVDISEDGEPTVVPSTGVTTEFIADGAVTQAKLDRVRQRVTHPNTTDTLIEVWDDGAGAWVVSDYDSGWRDVSSLLSNAAKFQTWDKVVMRRVGAQVQVTVRATVGTGTASGTTAGFTLFTIPTGFVPVEYSSYGYAQTGFSGLAPNLSSIHNMSTLNVLALGNVSSNWNNFAFGTVTWFTGDTLPSSLPGTSA